MKEYVQEWQAGFGCPHTKRSSSACAIDHEANHLLPFRKPHPMPGCLCCWKAPGWDEQIQRKRGSAACPEKLCCFIASPLSTYSGRPWVGWRLAWEGGRPFFQWTRQASPPPPPPISTASHADPSLSLPQLCIHLTVITAEIPSGVSSLHVYYSFVYFFININCCYLCEPVHLAQFWWAVKAPNWK